MNAVNPGSSQQQHVSSTHEPNFENEDIGEIQVDSAEKPSLSSSVTVTSLDRHNQNSHRGPQTVAFGEPSIDPPASEAVFRRGESIFGLMLTTLLKFANGVMERRAERLETMNELQTKLHKISVQESEKTAEQIDKANSKKKSGLFGKLMAVISIVVAVVITAVSFGTMGPLALTFMAAGAAMAMETLFNDGKLTDKLMSATVGKLSEVLGNILEKCGVPENIANGIAIGVVLVAVIALSVVGSKNVSAADKQIMAGMQMADKAKSLAQVTKLADQAQDAATLATQAKNAGNMSKASQLVNKSQKLADQASDYARKALEAADTLDYKAAKTGAKTADTAAKNARAAADDALKHAKSLFDKSQDAQESAGNARTAVHGAEAHENFVKARKAVKALQSSDAAVDNSNNARSSSVVQEQAAKGSNVSVEMIEQSKDITKMLEALPPDGRFNNLQKLLAMSNIALEAGKTGHKTAIDIINTKLDYLIAQDQADIETLKAVLAYIQQFLELQTELSEEEAQVYENMAERISTIANVSIAKISNPFNFRIS